MNEQRVQSQEQTRQPIRIHENRSNQHHLRDLVNAKMNLTSFNWFFFLKGFLYIFSNHMRIIWGGYSQEMNDNL